MAAGITLTPLLTEIKINVAGFKSDMEKVKSEAVSKANEVSNQMEKTIKVGDKMSNIGGKLTKSVTLPLVGAGVAATKMAMDYETSFAKVSTLLDKNVVDYDKYKKDILDASSKSKVAVGEFSEAVYGSISAGVDQTKAIKFTTDAMKLAKGGFTDGAKAVDVMTTAINGYGLKAEDATKISDMLITTQNLGKTTVDELASSMGAVIPVANSVNFGIDELSASYAQLTKNGIATAESGTYMKAMLSELGKSGSITDKALRELTGKGFADLKKEGKSTSEILGILSDYAEKNGKTLKDMFGSVEAGSAALVLAKGDGAEYNEMLDAMNKSAGATQEAFDKMDATPADQLKGTLNELKNEAIKLGAKAIPIVTEAAKFISKLVDGFSSLSPEMQDGIIKFGLFAAAAGPVLKVGGKLVSTYGKLKPIISGTGTLLKKGVPLLGKIGTSLSSSAGLVGKVGGALSKLAPAASTASTALTTVAGGAASAGGAAATAAGVGGVGGLLSSLGGIAVAAAPWVAGAAAVGAAAYGIYKVLDQDVIPEVDLFKTKTTATFNETTGQYEVMSTKVSESTKKQVQAYMDLSDKAQQESMNMYLGITAVTDENVGKINSKVNQMSDSIIAATEKQKTEVVKNYKDMFSQTTAITESEQTEILANITKSYDEREKKTKDLRDKIVGINEDIRKQGTAATKSQQEELDALYKQMKEQAIQSMSSSKAEQEVILNNLNESNTRITADMAGKAIKEMNKIEKESIKSAKNKRDELVRQASELKEIEGGKYKDKADAIIKEANREYDETVKAAKGIKKDGIDKLMEAHSDLADDVDVTTGEVVSYWDKLFGTWDKWKPEEKTAVTNYVERYSKEYTASYKGSPNVHHSMAANGLEYVPYDGYNARLHKGERVLTQKENEEYSEEKITGRSKDKITLEVPVIVNGKEFAHATIDDILEEAGFGR